MDILKRETNINDNKNKDKKKKYKINSNIIIYVLVLTFSCIIFWKFLDGHYATDTFRIWGLGYLDYVKMYWLNDGRIIMSIVGFIAHLIKIPIDLFVSISTFLGLAFSSLAVISLYRIILKYKDTDNKYIKGLVLIISCITIFNFMYIENIYFVDIFAMSISINVYILAAYILCNKNKHYFIKSLLLVILGIFSYQGTICVFIAFSLLFTILKNIIDININKEVIKDLLKTALIVLISVCLNLIFVKIIGIILEQEQTRISSIKDIFINIFCIFTDIMPHVLFTTCELYPKGVFLGVLTLIIAVFVIYSRKQNETWTSLWLILLVLLTIMSAFAVSLLSLTSLYSGRLRFVIGALIGIVYFYMYAKTNVFFEKNIIRNILSVILIIYFIFGIGIYIYNIELHEQSNMITKQEVLVLNEYMSKYEIENNKKIKYIACVYDGSNSNKTYTNQSSKTSLTSSALKCTWSIKDVINFYTDRKLIRIYEKSDKDLYNKFIDTGLEYVCYENILFIKYYRF